MRHAIYLARSLTLRVAAGASDMLAGEACGACTYTAQAGWDFGGWGDVIAGQLWVCRAENQIATVEAMDLTPKLSKLLLDENQVPRAAFLPLMQ